MEVFIILMVFSLQFEFIIVIKLMPTFTQFIQTPEAFILEDVVAQNPELMDKFIEYLTIPQDPMLSNERQCYLYPSKIADLFSIGMSYRLLIEKKQNAKNVSFYPHLSKLFVKINQEKAEPTLLGYCCKVLISLVKKTPEIYQFIKDNQQILTEILRDDSKLSALRDFFSLFLIQSTMDLYSFLKSMVMRALILRVVQDENPSVIIFRSISYFYSQIIKSLEDSPEDEKPQLLQVSKIFEEEHFITLMILKLDSQHSQRSSEIAQFLCNISERSMEGVQVISLHIDSILDYLQQYEQTSAFMDTIKKDHIAILSLFVQLAKLSRLSNELIAQLIKRLLVYSNVHANNSFVHNLLFKTIQYCREQGKEAQLNQLNIIEFFVKNTTTQRCGFMALRRRVFEFWITNKLDGDLNEEERKSMEDQHRQRASKVEKSRYYKPEDVRKDNQSTVMQSAALVINDQQKK